MTVKFQSAEVEQIQITAAHNKIKGKVGKRTISHQKNLIFPTLIAKFQSNSISNKQIKGKAWSAAGPR